MESERSTPSQINELKALTMPRVWPISGGALFRHQIVVTLASLYPLSSWSGGRRSVDTLVSEQCPGDAGCLIGHGDQHDVCRSRHYCGEGILTHPSHQGVCERHGTEDLDVTPGGLVVFPGGTEITDPISREAKWERMRGEQSDNRIVLQARRKPGDRASGGRVCRGSRLAEVVGARRGMSE